MITVFLDNNSQVALAKSVNFPFLTTTAIYPCEGQYVNGDVNKCVQKNTLP